MHAENWQKPLIDELLSSPVGQILEKAMNTIADVQKHLYALAASEDSSQLKLLEIATVFQLFLIRTLASGKKFSEIGKDGWKKIADKISKYAILNDESCYSEFVFLSYSSYIDGSAKLLSRLTKNQDTDSILELSETIRSNTERMNRGELSEQDYTEACLWLSLEAMLKLLSTLLSSVLSPFVGRQTAQLAQAVSQLGFEYGRYVLFSQEHVLLEEYLENQHTLDEHLRTKYDQFLVQLQENSEQFHQLIDAAFSADIPNSLRKSAELARSAGVAEEELLTTTDDVDAFFLD